MIPPLNGLWAIINKADWSDKYFSLEKAYVCSALSEIAYQHIPEYEVKNSKRIKIVPCQHYREIIKSKNSTNIRPLLQSADFGNFFIIETRFVVLIGIITNKVIFIAIRGTYELYDWMVNLNARKYVLSTESNAKLHLWFYRAIVTCFDQISNELNKSSIQSDTPIYVTGHSLGGAMGAILHSQWTTFPSSLVNPIGPLHNYRIFTHSCYTFGMPRYGNTEAVMFRPPFHLYNKLDIVPSLPPKWLGYENSIKEYQLDGLNISYKSKRESVRFINWLFRLLVGIAIKNHNIEIYKQRIYEKLF